MRLLGRPALALTAVYLLVATTGCYQPTYAPCSVRCTSATGCPSGYSCGEAGYCQAEGNPTSCGGEADGGDGGGGTGERYLALSAGDRHTCGIREDGSLWCWGENSDGQLGDGSYTASTVPLRVGLETNWTAVSAAHEHTCGIQDPGILSCWGDNWLGELGTGDLDQRNSPIAVSTNADWVAVSASTDSTCGVRADGALYCWGSNDSGQVPGLEVACPDAALACAATPQLIDIGPWTSIAVGTYHGCGTKADGSLWCWGRAEAGQLGNGIDDDESVYPLTQIGTDRAWASVSGRRYHDCAVKTDGSAWCWGEGWFGEIGDGAESSRSVPTRVNGNKAWRTIAAGGEQSCGVVTDGTLWCWGHNLRGTLGNDDDRDQSVPIQVPGDWLEVTTGDQHSCARRGDGTAWCWGDDDFGQLGAGTRTLEPVPAEVAGGGAWTSVSVGYHHVCGLKDDGSLWCWGSSQGGELGNGATTGQETTPVQIGDDITWAEVAVGTGHTCALAGGAMYCWGTGADGQLGNGRWGEGIAMAEPSAVVGTPVWTEVAPDGISTAALDAEGSLWITGHGVGPQFARKGLDTDAFTSISSARDTYTTWETCAVRTDKTLWCTSVVEGDVVLGQIPPDGSWLEWDTVSLGGAFGCGLAASTLYCWGANGDGQLGNGGEAYGDVPSAATVDVGTLWTSVAAGFDHACGITTFGQLFCWGDNERGQLGNGDFDDVLTPTAISPGTTWTAVSTGYEVSCGIRSDGSLWCWGTNFAGQLGNGASASWQPAAVAAAR